MTNNFSVKKNGANSRPQLSPQEWAQKKQEEKDAVYSMIDDTAMEVVSTPENFRAFLDTQSRMDRYSSANALLIYRQRPDATQLKTFGDWSEENVKINKGEKSISILEPVEYTRKDGTSGVAYNVKKVFDVAQTSAKRQPAPLVNRDAQRLAAIMLDTAPVPIEGSDTLPHPEMGAFYDNEEQKLFVKRNLGDGETLCRCVAQELGHAQLALNADAYRREDADFQAGCIGYMLCKRFGIEPKNLAIDRLPDELKEAEPKEIRATLSQIRTAMSEINSRVSDALYRQKQERAKDRER
jgi:hypothetical protein